MRIGIDVSAVAYGTGVADYTLGLVKHLPEQSLNLFGFSLRRGSGITQVLPQAKVWPIPPTLADWWWNGVHKLDIENVVGKMDIYHSSDWVQAPSRSKKVTTIHDLSPFLYPQELDPQVVVTHTRRMKWVIRECDQIICVSRNTAEDLKRIFKVSDNRIKVIYEALPQRYLLTPQKIKFSDYLVVIGTRQPRKNVKRLISAYLTYKDKYRLPSKLIVVGEMGQAVSHPNVVFTGYVPDQTLVDLLAGAETFVYPSLYEGFGLPILGAFYHGVPVACAKTSSFPEVAGDAAILFDPLDEENMVQAVAKAIQQKDQLIRAGKKQLQLFSWQATAAATSKVYESLV